jgi:hypothetical protein
MVTRIAKAWVFLVVALNGCAFGSLHAGTQDVTSSPVAKRTVCQLLEDPARFEGKEVVLTGAVYLGVDSMNVSDGHCPGEVIRIVISDSVIDNHDIQEFYVKLNKLGRHGTATLVGKFSSGGERLSPYTIDVVRIRDVGPVNN